MCTELNRPIKCRIMFLYLKNDSVFISSRSNLVSSLIGRIPWWTCGIDGLGPWKPSECRSNGGKSIRDTSRRKSWRQKCPFRTTGGQPWRYDWRKCQNWRNNKVKCQKPTCGPVECPAVDFWDSVVYYHQVSIDGYRHRRTTKSGCIFGWRRRYASGHTNKQWIGIRERSKRLLANRIAVRIQWCTSPSRKGTVQCLLKWTRY